MKGHNRVISVVTGIFKDVLRNSEPRTCHLELAMRNANSKSDGVDSLDVNSSKHIVHLLFSSERCVVSEAASHLMHLVHKTLEIACARVASEFYNVARDLILLYEAVVPIKLEKQLDGVNQADVLLHNDCLYLFEEIIGLAFESLMKERRYNTSTDSLSDEIVEGFKLAKASC